MHDYILLEQINLEQNSNKILAKHGILSDKYIRYIG